ncbi:Autophagy protein 5 [Hibiscus syriacus]|uniref:Autophagy protein 5 n=1 Tax=Hibiscus syriacus TaxID=106335 RepID=A0A6A3D5C3_HIBSY|nr:Autophagy protein 5 [Hibiscus syriacus]
MIICCYWDSQHLPLKTLGFLTLKLFVGTDTRYQYSFEYRLVSWFKACHPSVAISFDSLVNNPWLADNVIGAAIQNTVIEIWSLPPLGFIKVNMDGATKNSWEGGGIGSLYKDQSGALSSYCSILPRAAYIMNGNFKNVMNMSQSDQSELWHSVMNGNMETYRRVSSKLKLATIDDESRSLCSQKSQQSLGETDLTAQFKTGRVPVRLYVLSVREDLDDLEEMLRNDSWEKISYINRPVEIHKEGK